jgi:hypothetical protein
VFDLFGTKAKRDAKRLADALEVVMDDMLGATDFGMRVSNPDHPFHESVKEANAALTQYRGFGR